MFRLPLFAMLCILLGAPVLAASRDGLTTSARVFDGKETCTIVLQPFRPLEYLNSKLPGLPEPNATVVRTILAYPRDGQHGYWWPRRGGGAL